MIAIIDSEIVKKSDCFIKRSMIVTKVVLIYYSIYIASRRLTIKPIIIPRIDL